MTTDTAALVAALEAYERVWQGWPASIDASNVRQVREAAMKAALAKMEAENSRLRAENGTLVTKAGELAQRMGGEMQLLQDAASAVLIHRIGSLPTRGWLSDTPDSRKALDDLAALIPAPLAGKQEGR